MANHVILDRLWDSDKLAACSVKAQLHYPRIYLLCDDWACFEIDVVSIRKTVYKKMQGVKEPDIYGWLKEYMEHGLLFVWAIGHNEYGYWTGPEEGRLPSPSRRHKRKTPEPPIEELSAYLQKHEKTTKAYRLTTKAYNGLHTPSVKGLGLGIGLGIGKEGGVGETNDEPTSFDRFWKAYPKKRAKGDAEKAWKELRPSEPLVNQILATLELAKTSADWLKDGGQYIPYPATWLRRKGWEDDFKGQGTILDKDAREKAYSCLKDAGDIRCVTQVQKKCKFDYCKACERGQNLEMSKA